MLHHSCRQFLGFSVCYRRMDKLNQNQVILLQKQLLAQELALYLKYNLKIILQSQLENLCCCSRS